VWGALLKACASRQEKQTFCCKSGAIVLAENSDPRRDDFMRMKKIS